MVNFTSKFFTIIELLCSIILILPVITKCENYDDRVHPDAWSLSSKSESYANKNNNKKISHQSYCNTQNMEEEIAFIYYKKLIKNLFNREKFEYNEKTDSYYIQFVLTKFQFDKLEEVKDLRNLDSIVNQILLNAQTLDSEKSSLFVSIWDAIWNGMNTIYSKICSAIVFINYEFFIRYAVWGFIVFIFIIVGEEMPLLYFVPIIIFGLWVDFYKYCECNLILFLIFLIICIYGTNERKVRVNIFIIFIVISIANYQTAIKK